ncbi:MAG: enoyl-CoA hydratase/isomerase family protein [Candidatus Heimdallarchaeota archaeon]
MSSKPLLLVEKEGYTVTVSLNRPEKRNALNTAMFEAIDDVFTSLQSNRHIRMVFVKGCQHNNREIFSSGIDVVELGQAVQESNLTTIKHFQTIAQNSFNKVEKIEKPTIALIDGYAYGAGLELALACDFRVMTENAKVGLLETALGVIPDLGGTTRLVRMLGTSVARKIIMFAEKWSAQKALKYDLVDWVVPEGELLAKANELSHRLLRNAPLALGIAKRLIDQVYGLDLDRALLLEKLAQLELLKSEDTIEAFMANMENREPNFKSV